MDNRLYFICPTDGLEPIIENNISHNSYYFSILGGSIEFEKQDVEYIKDFIQDKCITQMTFVLSDKNPIINDILNQKKFTDLESFNRFCVEIESQRKRFSMLLQINNILIPILLYFLDKKIESIKKQLDDYWFINTINFNAKIYNTKTKKFSDIDFKSCYDKFFVLN